MPKFYDSISDDLATWALKQSVFFTASAPLVGKHVNISPKGLPNSTFTIFSPNQAAYIDATGSGSETICHLYENGRITIMFCSFDTTPRIMRFFCTGKVVEWDRPEFPKLLERMGKKPVLGARAIIMLDVFKVQTSCGYGVPRLSRLPSDESGTAATVPVFEDRDTMGHWASNKIEKNELLSYQVQWNSNSLDNLTGLRSARRDKGELLWFTDLQAWFRRIAHQKEAVFFGFVLAVLLFTVARLLQVVIPR